MLALDGQAVRWYWYTFEFESVIDWYTMHDGTIVIVLSPDTFTTMAMTHDSALMLAWLELLERGTRVCANFDWIHILCTYGTVSCWRHTNRKYVSMGARFNMDVSSLDLWCTIIALSYSFVIKLQWQWCIIRLCSDVDWIYGTTLRWLLTNRKYVVICACLTLSVS